MRIARFVVDGDPLYGVVDGENVHVLAGDPFFQGIKTTGAVHPLDDVRLVAPIIPRSKVVGFGRTYSEHAKELGNEVPPEPLMFLKPNTSVVGHGEPVTLPAFSQEVSFEGELAVVIGRICKDVPAEKASDVIFGYTIANDLTARDAQRTDPQWARAKGFDGSCPLGPWIETELEDPDDVAITTRLNGEVRQDGSTKDMIWPVSELVARASEAFTLLPGDVIMTGTPAGVGLVDAGDIVEIELEGLGTLRSVFRR
ncbi:fumarylacetoacetate hydrolase family protein [Glutamicibacter protophormiae]|uniref:2-keto-4-pentenoate hydratase/2-oxohepta-3-ene-1,7-dioic acid hydratase in catechol pathway n=1 Tax=Glutamicibacter protophormiae TaxID=37930 RepID=A0ABS4XSD2_GLUPR|nr:fumarylacetoacetate hydrolase family protein [Glutamicibacter protophormiae]MBP2399424.1 2-keto-4-pentenoate hydratase/2-oxohepta-3-ene-1,7-dioic acid hydratase in catechol pathway [Glutamicibacter protophormiae]GGL84932.1 2-hydroxyhepta-2,4-diene-1,7-dioate isomerase [Glutamicibacter protophormiae]